MAAKKKSKFENKFRSTAASESRTANVRDERKVKDEQPKLSFNFKDFDFNQCPPGQTLEKWQEEKMLDKLVGRFVEVCSFTIIEAVQQGLLRYMVISQKTATSKFLHISRVRFLGGRFGKLAVKSQGLQVTS